MNFVIGIFPGLALSCFLFFLVLAAAEFFVYSKKGYLRSRYILLFCLFASVHAAQQFVVQSRRFDPVFSLYFGYVSQLAVILSYYYYLKAMRYYVAFSDRVANIMYLSLLGLFLARFVVFPVLAISGEDVFYNLGQLKDSGSYFFNSYTMRAGTPTIYPVFIMHLFSVITTFISVYLLRIVMKGSRDLYLITGLIMTMFTALYQYFLLPFTLKYFVPLVFLSNIFEAIRMSFLSIKEYIIKTEKELIGEEPVEESSGESYQNTALSRERIDELALQLKQILADPAVYTDPELRLEDLARKLKVPTYQVSQVFSLGLDMGYHEAVNQARIQYVQKLMVDSSNKDQNIMELAAMAGFNSKSTFNSAFKKYTGVTPSAYRKQHQ